MEVVEVSYVGTLRPVWVHEILKQFFKTPPPLMVVVHTVSPMLHVGMRGRIAQEFLISVVYVMSSRLTRILSREILSQ